MRKLGGSFLRPFGAFLTFYVNSNLNEESFIGSYSRQLIVYSYLDGNTSTRRMNETDKNLRGDLLQYLGTKLVRRSSLG